MTQHEQFCQACGIPMSAPDAQGASEKYCAYCSDSDGNLKSWKRRYPAWRGFSIHGKKLAKKNRASGQYAI